MTQQTSDCDKKIRQRATEVAEKKMPANWDRKSLTYLNVFNAYLLEAIQAEYNRVIMQAHSSGYLDGATKSLKMTESLKEFYDSI